MWPVAKIGVYALQAWTPILDALYGVGRVAQW